jgi:hypothetical protein
MVNFKSYIKKLIQLTKIVSCIFYCKNLKVREISKEIKDVYEEG